jgi:hypothetical protein
MDRRTLLKGLLSAHCVGAARAADDPHAAVVGVDHIVVTQQDPGALFALLSHDLRLPVIWPLTQFGSSASGGVFLGNVVVECARATGAGASNAARVAGIAFRPVGSTADCLQTLDARRIAHGVPEPYQTTVGNSPKTLWTTTEILDLAPAGVAAFVCEYHFATAPGLATAATALRERAGGPLGLVGARDLVIASPDALAAAARWRALLAPAPEPAPGQFALPEGPAIQVEAGSRDKVQALTLVVASLARARTALAGLSINRRDAAGALQVDDAGVFGLALRLVQA